MSTTMMPAKRQSFRSKYGRKGITVPAECPTYAIRRRLGRVHVGTSFEDVETMIRESVAHSRNADPNGLWTAKAERDAIRFALWQHEENSASYAWVMGSH
jgi:hypothetical protein